MVKFIQLELYWKKEIIDIFLINYSPFFTDTVHDKDNPTLVLEYQSGHLNVSMLVKFTANTNKIQIKAIILHHCKWSVLKAEAV